MEDRAARDHRQHRRHVDRWLGLLIVVVAVVSGFVAAHFGTHHAWERGTAGTTSATDQVQGSK